MAMVTVTSTLEANISKNLNTKTGTNFRDASFSSYLNGAEETFILDLGSSRSLSKKQDDGEIDIFSAEKYFNEGVDEENQEKAKTCEPQHKHKMDEAYETGSVKQKTGPTTPSIYSESSWNSRSALLHNISRNHQQQPQSKPHNMSYGKKLLASLGCNCYCKDKNSIKVDGESSFDIGKYHAKAKQNPIKRRSSAHSSGSCSSAGANQEVHFKKIDELRIGVPVFDQKAGKQEEETPRKSLEVFGTPATEKDRIRLSLERKLSALSWGAIAPKPEEIDSINIGASSNEDDYAESEASSDLFEIASFISNNPGLARQTSDGTTCYAPSEVSIDWSVVTASAADFSVISDSEELKMPSLRTNSIRREKPKRRSSILLGCNSHKAVGVLENTLKASEKTSLEVSQRNLKSQPILQMTRFHAENKLAPFDAGKRQHDFTSRSFSSSYTGRPADFLYI